jgi:homoserine dehydrogenase
MDIARGSVLPAFAVPAASLERLATLPIERHSGSQYIRLMVLDRPGVIADIAAALRDEEISVEALLQRGRAPDEVVPVVITTHDTQDAAMTRALERIGEIEAVIEPPRRIRVEAL